MKKSADEVYKESLKKYADGRVICLCATFAVSEFTMLLQAEVDTYKSLMLADQIIKEIDSNTQGVEAINIHFFSDDIISIFD